VSTVPAGSKNILDDHVWAVSMKHIMPTVAQIGNAAESWEALASSLEHPSSVAASTSNPPDVEHNASRVLPGSRLNQLRHLTWPRVPIKTAELLARKFPVVSVNPTPGSCPIQADPAAALDEAAMHMVAPFWQQEQL